MASAWGLALDLATDTTKNPSWGNAVPHPGQWQG